jgi:hypothetical protein
MAFRTGTATDYLDLLTTFRDFITGADSPASGLNWTAVRDVLNSPEEREMIFRGTGGVSPEDQIFFGINTYSDSGVGRFNWDLRGFTGFTDGSPEGSVAFAAQPGISPASSYIPLENSSMTYWMYGNDRRVMMVVKTGTAYQFMHAGLLNTFSTSTEFPYPLCIIGSSWDVDQRFNDNAVDYASVPNPGSDLASAGNTGPCLLRFVDGVWYGFQNFGDTAPETDHPDDRFIWPMAANFSVTDDDHDGSNRLLEGFSLINYFRSIFTSATPGGTPQGRLLRGFGSPQPSPLFPLTLIMAKPSRQFLGELDNIFWINGTGGLSAEDNLIDSGVSPEESYDIFQNIHRTDDWTLYAIKRE